MPETRGGRRTGEFNQALVTAQTEITLLKKRVERLESELLALRNLVATMSREGGPPKSVSSGPPPLPKTESAKAVAGHRGGTRTSVVDISDMAELLDEGARISVLPAKPRDEGGRISVLPAKPRDKAMPPPPPRPTTRRT